MAAEQTDPWERVRSPPPAFERNPRGAYCFTFCVTVPPLIFSALLAVMYLAGVFTP